MAKDRLYNLKKVNELTDGDPDFNIELVATFIEEIAEDLELLLAAEKANNATEIHRYAHKMKPGFILFGIDVVKEVKMLENWRDGVIDFEQAKPAIAYINKVAKVAMEQLKNDFNL